MFLYKKSPVSQLVIYKPGAYPGTEFQLVPAAYGRAGYNGDEWKAFDVNACCFDGFVFQWPDDGSILLAASFQPNEIALAFCPMQRKDGLAVWCNPGDWLADNAAVGRHQEFFKSRKWEQISPLSEEGFSKLFGDAWMDLVNSDYIRAFHHAYIRALENHKSVT